MILISELVYISDNSIKFTYGKTYKVVERGNYSTLVWDDRQKITSFANGNLYYWFQTKERWREIQLEKLGII